MANQLANETSPYLLQHRENPVHWYPWCEKALELAVKHDKPIFLSIGYSACHWCHVMESESFENESIAEFLNQNFVSIKVDREERPDIDQIYMNALMALQRGQGGWPLNVFLTPQQQVFFGGTYWPPIERMGLPGFDQVLREVRDAFLNRRDEVDQQAQKITNWLNRKTDHTSKENQSELNYNIIEDAVQALQQSFDFKDGGFGDAPKFPRTMDLLLLVRMAHGKNSPQNDSPADMLAMIELTLKKMAYGGIFDHLGGGFARYSVDAQWLVPHFEKMLYDNALLAQLYIQMFQLTGNRFYSMIATKTLNYLLRDMLDDSGGIHSSEDADSEGEEGKFYVWSQAEIFELLKPEKAERFCTLYNVTEHGNFEGKNILHMTRSYQDFADSIGIEKESLRDEMRVARETLLKARESRMRPAKDDKILASWNGFAISAFAQASLFLDDKLFLDTAQDAAKFVLKEMRDELGRMTHTWRNGIPKVRGFLDDYSSMILALLDLYSADFDQKWIERAFELAEQMIAQFHDRETGGFFFTAEDSEKLITRPKSFQDGSVPSGNGLAALGLLRLGRIIGSNRFIEIAHTTFMSASEMLRQTPLATGQLLLGLKEQLSQPIQLVLVSNTRQDVFSIGQKLATAGKPEISLLFQDSRYEPETCLQAYLSGKTMQKSRPTLYVCRGNQCDDPIVGQETILAAIDEIINV